MANSIQRVHRRIQTFSHNTIDMYGNTAVYLPWADSSEKGSGDSSANHICLYDMKLLKWGVRASSITLSGDNSLLLTVGVLDEGGTGETDSFSSGIDLDGDTDDDTTFIHSNPNPTNEIIVAGATMYLYVKNGDGTGVFQGSNTNWAITTSWEIFL